MQGVVIVQIALTKPQQKFLSNKLDEDSRVAAVDKTRPQSSASASSRQPQTEGILRLNRLKLGERG